MLENILTKVLPQIIAAKAGENRTSFERGVLAFTTGEGLDRNPFKMNSKGFEQWKNGWFSEYKTSENLEKLLRPNKQKRAETEFGEEGYLGF
jgi:hypothetical protein